MTAQLLPPIVPSPFSKSFESVPYSLHNSAASLHSAPTSFSAFSLNTVIQRARQPSPTSIFSIASAPLLTNNENLSFGTQCSPQSPSASPVPSGNEAYLGIRRPAAHRLASCPQTWCRTKDAKVYGNSVRSDEHTEDGNSRLRNALRELGEYQSAKADSTSCTVTDVQQLPRNIEASIPTTLKPPRYDDTSSAEEPERDSKQKAAETPPQRTRTADEIPSEAIPIVEQSFFEHRKRLSTTSSGFVHTVKTASFSNGSFSVLSKSLQLGRSSETHAMFGSHSRFSAESERPPTTSSLDDAALRRNVKRRYILDEIMSTEESYIADLKALVYLMSTLLASATSISSRVRAFMQQNVLDLLHLHEVILERCHKAAFKAAARKWADTISPPLVGSTRHIRFRSLESYAAARLGRVHRRTRSSTDSHDFSRGRDRLTDAEPADVTDIILIFKSLMMSFFAYEEYCANHEIIAHDLQKNLPTLWSTYEAGMESLARSIVSLDHREPNSRRGLTVGDLLVKPIQRVCRYPLLFEDLLRHTPVADCPSAHADVELVLRQFKDLVQTVNTATDSPGARFHTYRRWSLLSRLNLDQSILHQDDFRMLGNSILCGVLYLTYQTRSNVDGAYALCVLFRSSFLIALPNGGNGSFDLTAFIMLSDLKLESASDGKGSLTPRYLTHANGCIGLQAPSALHTWKLCFTVEGNLHEFLLSACSAAEEEQWRRGLRGELGSDPCPGSSNFDLPTRLVLELKAVGVVYDRHGTLARRLSVQRAATVGNRASICQVILRNTYNAEELHEFRQLSTSAIKRSHSHLTTNRPVVLSPKRSERARLEAMLSDIWTKDKLPYPGMIASRGGQIIRASAGSLVRKLSLASIHGPFSRRSASLTIPSRKSYEAFSDSRRSRERLPTFEVCRDSFEHKPALKNKLTTAHDLPELDTMDSVINRMIGDHNKMPSPAGGDGIRRRGTLKKQPVKVAALPVGPNDSAQTFYPEEVEKAQKEAAIEDVLTGKKKRWSNPMALLKRPLKEGIRGLVYSSR